MLIEMITLIEMIMLIRMIILIEMIKLIEMIMPIEMIMLIEMITLIETIMLILDDHVDWHDSLIVVQGDLETSGLTIPQYLVTSNLYHICQWMQRINVEIVSIRWSFRWSFFA